MSLFVRQMKFGQFYIHNKYRLINLWTTAHNNLISDSNNINKKNYSCYADLLLPDNVIKKYLNTIVTAYVSKDKTNDEFASIMQIQDVVNLLENRLQIDENIKSLKELGEQDEEMQKLGQEEYTGYQNHLTQLDENLIDIILNNTGRDDCKDIIFDITAGIGGQEAILFTADLFFMYRKHFEYLGFNHDLIEANTESGTGGLRHASFIVSGVGAFELLRHEGGVHRVQRVPSTEKSGRIHTSTASVVVLPQPSEIEVNLLDKDLRIETKRSSGAGGQSVNKTESAVRIVHLPTGIAVEAQSERTQVRNKQLALLKLRTQIYDKQLNEQKSVAGSFRKKQRGMCQRNEKVRTYNYNQDRITDHRLANGTFHNLKNFMEGGEVLENLQKQLQMNFQLQLLRELIENCK